MTGDQDVEVTLGRLKQGVVQCQWVFENLQELQNDLKTLKDAVFGPAGREMASPPPKNKKVNLFRILLTRKRMVKETVESLGPVSLVLFAIADSLDHTLDSTWSSLASLSNEVATVDPAISTLTSGVMKVMESLGWFGTNALLTLVFLAVVRFILAERDEFLAESIHQSCIENKQTKVMAVVGLLHCNGVARLLRERGFQ